MKHSKGRQDLAGAEFGVPATPEGQATKLADATAYVCHDVEDAVRAGLLREADLPTAVRQDLGASTHQRLDTIVHDIIDTSWAVSGAPREGPSPSAEGRAGGREGCPPASPPPQVKMSPVVYAGVSLLREFLFQHVYDIRARGPEAEEARETMRFLFRYFMDHPHRLPEEYRPAEGEPPERRAVDYIAGMTDNFALRLARELRG
ncbi:MAG: hypothetical protein HY671_08775 [Chloroflexi bacterium]|nr:hypothetical protein [Chloroflexota bacterium]